MDMTIMKLLLKTTAFIGLAMTVVPSVFVFKGVLPWDIHARFMAVGMVLWFTTAPFVMKRKED